MRVGVDGQPGTHGQQQINVGARRCAKCPFVLDNKMAGAFLVRLPAALDCRGRTPHLGVLPINGCDDGAPKAPTKPGRAWPTRRLTVQAQPSSRRMQSTWN